MTRIPHKILKDSSKAGIDIRKKDLSGTLLHIDNTTIYSKVNDLFKEQLELMDTKEALQNYQWLKDYRWKLIDPNKDEFTQKVAENFSGGYFMRILPNVEVTFPLQSCLMITKRNSEQKVHNIIIAEEGSKAHIISGCVQHHTLENTSHLGISEFYVKKGAVLNFTMIHDWNEKTLFSWRES